MTKSPKSTRSRGWQFAASVFALSVGAGLAAPAAADEPLRPEGTILTPQIIPNDGLNPFTPPPTGVLDTGVIGIGQMITDVPPAGGSVGLCTGTLINPRTVIFNAHCVNNAPGSAYGGATGGIALSFGFNDNNLPAAQNWISNNWHTNTALNIYNANQVWWDPRSRAPESCTAPTSCFLEGDIAIATLDTPATNIPTWALLFSPLTAETHAEIVGYGTTGTGTTGGSLGIDFRRRAAENMLSTLASLDDVDLFLFGPPLDGLPQSLYQMDFDDPAGTNPFDFDIFDGPALPGESITGGGDSGGPLIVDQQFDIPVVVGTLSGGTRFFGAQPSGSYGTTSFYQPLFLFWDVIVQNNSYVYANARPGNADWMNPAHWVQAMDPNYMVVRNGELANDLPDTPAQGVSGAGTQFGTVCFLDDCQDLTQSGPGENSTGPGLVIPGGPGTLNFVPNNIEPNRITGVQAHYYDVTLAAVGETRLSNNVTIDRFTIDGLLTGLDVRSAGVLNVFGDFNMGRGFVNVDGRVNAGEALLLQGVLTGSGTFNPSFLTSVDGVIAPGQLLGIGTLTVQGDVVLASGNELLIELGRTTNDVLRITADPLQHTTGNIALGGDLWLTPALGAGAPRDKQVYTIVLADGSVLDSFDSVNGFLGILRPQITYLPNAVQVKLKAGSFLDLFLHAPELAPFALALDELRENHYDNLYDLYGQVDLMDVNSLARTFNSFRPNSLIDAHGLMAMQDNGFATTLQGRIALLSRDTGPLGLSLMGSPDQVLAFSGNDGLGAAVELSFATMMTQSTTVQGLPRGMSAFVSGGYTDARESAEAGHAALSPNDSMQSWNMTGGVEQSFGAFTLGIAAAYSHGNAFQANVGSAAENDLTQTAAYGVYRFDNGAYVSALVGAGVSRTATDRQALAYMMHGNAQGELFIASVEGGVNLNVTRDLVLTPNVGLRQTNLRMDGFTESGGEAALAIDEQTSNRLEGRAGARLAGDFSLGRWLLTPDLDVAMVANLAGDETGVWARFAAAPDVSFYLPGAARDDFWGEVAGGLQLVRGDTSFALRLETSVAREELHEDRVTARVARRF